MSRIEKYKQLEEHLKVYIKNKPKIKKYKTWQEIAAVVAQGAKAANQGNQGKLELTPLKEEE